MNIVLKKWVWLVTITALLIPFMASAHATPVAMSPPSSEILDAVPAEVVIHFSERVDASASEIVIKSPSMTMHGPTQASPSDARVLRAPVMDGGDGTYLVSWSVVSADDGHFTKGAYAFAVGKGAGIATTTASTEIIQVATTPEALAMTVELFGNGMLWATLLLFAFAVRPLFATRQFATEERTIKRGYSWLLVSGAMFAFCGAALQILVKTADLAMLREISFAGALPLYISTAAGFATLVRMFVVAAVCGIFFIGRKSILQAVRITAYEICMLLAMCVFAYFRAKISHATANPFYPDFSIAVNFLHLIEKDIWAGVMLILVLITSFKKLRAFLVAFVPRAFRILAIDFAAVSVTATYIVWLHLKSFDNLFTTKWGGAFLALFAAAVCLVSLRIYHTVARIWIPQRFAAKLPVTFAVEFAFALLVVYYSSFVIITSPPLSEPPAPVYSAHDQGISIVLAHDPYEDGMMLLTASGDGTKTPVVTVEDTQGTIGTVSVELSKRFDGGYVFPQSLLSGQGPLSVAITVPQTNAYDTHAIFLLPTRAYDVPLGWELHRPFDSFAISMILFATAALIVAFALFHFSASSSVFAFTTMHTPGLSALAAFLVTMYIGANAIFLFSTSSLANPFKAECEADGNMWHLMLPTKAGVPTSETPREGCMWGMGKYVYMFADQREYDYYTSLPHADVVLDHTSFVAGTPSKFSVSLKEQDGSPAKLFVDMEKFVHVVVVSRDQTVFAHIHPDDVRPLTAQEIENSTFTLNYTFPKSGEYMISVDYAHGLVLEAKQFVVHVKGVPSQENTAEQYNLSGNFAGYDVTLDHDQLFAGSVSTIRYRITKDGEPVQDIVPYLSAAMHISVVKNDLSAFIHTHGEIHAPGQQLPPIIVKDGKVLHSMASMMTPDHFGSPIEAHLIFSSSGSYTIWGEFKVGDQVIPTSVTVQVE